ncbi:phosphoinositide 3-kinase regulatory subunit 6-like [Paramormyrops kingsleyae]|uniref:Phosphoinositide-3-kinase regulatory subunit 6 n=1 Tax=Paramormyrops kingsleyae TaxID=1676925 RepID=A0A3B3RSZ3_9TELE|nr:phosphoinositide 3-kinase regulatory subunit 6-like [Paramormyrops kingsleyae]XP_023691947.1 phosphoinositide 3-kinase regulatory subunit 6-like [Paramormyrops kingsleyae]XP_023691948.1 phosphoinositide 3-kinase regulatory subunit 6-like [Paramormyrops kingsleyae]XP_023691949.1 phosphoinositide 3-kinase regulatory subunit 6-like [Paramormyrops kingsleyae]XP_023691950.1 phosphoinositide 3-kinase regulatory subunit 6-like [Paramormyrops kingsleyae]
MTANASWDSSRGSQSAAGEGDGLVSIESNIYRSLQTILRELNNHTLTVSQSKGVLRWTLHKTVLESPKHCVLLVKILVKELEKVKRLQYRTYIIPLLHTLIYAVYQSVYLPDDLCQRTYDLCKQLLTLPHPYCTIGLAYARLIKMEQITPGALYQRRILAEQRLQNSSFSLQEKVFVFADPAVFPDSLVTGVAADLEPEATFPGELDSVGAMVLHTLQAAMGESCNGAALKQALESLGCVVELFFHKVVSTLAQHTGDVAADRNSYCAKLQRIYEEILRTARLDASEGGPLCSCSLPNPELNFRIWREDNELWGAVIKFVRASSLNYSQECEEPPTASLGGRSRQLVTSTDSGIMRDIGTQDQPSLTRRAGQRRRLTQSDRMALMRESLEEPHATTGAPLPKDERPFTARIVVMGDDRTVGRLAKAYHSLRQREARCLYLTTKVSLELYYIPVSSESPVSLSEEGNIFPQTNLAVSSYLEKMDPWYECNISSLGRMIPKMAKMPASPNRRRKSDSFLPDVISYYIRTAIQPIYLTIYSVKIIFFNPGSTPVEDVFVCHLELDFPNIKMTHINEGSFRITRSTAELEGVMISVKYKRLSVSSREEDTAVSLRVLSAFIDAIPTTESEDPDLSCLTVNFGNFKSAREVSVRTCNIKIRTLENKAFCVCLDKDSRRTFKDVQCVEISRCLDPGFSLQKPSKPQPANFSLGDTKDTEEDHSATHSLPLPLNTFAGVGH